MAREDARGPNGEEPIHGWFELSYANYLVLHRTLLQSMPYEWQQRFIDLLEEYERAFEHVDRATECKISWRHEGQVVRDPVPHYERGRTYVEPKK